MTPNLSKNWINHMFDAILYINMEKSIDRKNHIESEFSHFTRPLIRINATTPEIVGIDNLRKIVHNNQSFDEYYRIKGLTRQNQNEISLGLSHSSAITKAIQLFEEQGFQKILVIEDDAVITPFDESKIDRLMSFDDYEIWQLGYTIFNENLGSWLLEREYSIKSKALPLNFATADKGIFGTLGYVVNINSSNVEKFKKLAYEFSQGSISDFCLSEQKYLRKVVYREKLLMPLETPSTISTLSEYSAVEDGYKLNIFDENLVEGTRNFDQTSITSHRESCQNRLAYLVIEHQNSNTLSSYLKSYFVESTEDIIKSAEELFFKECEEHQFDVKRSYVIVFPNLSKPNKGQRYFIQQ